MDAGFLRDWTPGERLTAEHMQEIKRLLEKNSSGPYVADGTEGTLHTHPPNEHRIVWVHNDSGATVSMGYALALDTIHSDYTSDPYLSRFWGEGVYSGIKPAEDKHTYRYGIMLVDSGSGVGNPAIVSGETFAKVNIQEEVHDFAHADIGSGGGEGSHVLISDVVGNAHILWREREGGTGEMWCRVRISNPPSNLFRSFVMYSALSFDSCDDSATVFLLESEGDGSCWTETETDFTVYNPHHIFSKPATKDGYTGCRGIARFWEESGWWEIHEMEQIAEWIRFTLDEDMYAGEAAATVTEYYRGHDPDDFDLDGGAFKVHDPDDLFPRALDDCKGIAKWDNENQRYVVVECQQAAQFLRATASAFDTDDDPVTVSSPVVANRESDVLEPDTTSATNPFGCSRADSGPVLLSWDQAAQKYMLIAPYQFPYETTTIDVLAYQEDDDGPIDVNDSTQTMGYYLTQITVLAKGNEGTRQVYYTGTTCP